MGACDYLETIYEKCTEPTQSSSPVQGPDTAGLQGPPGEKGESSIPEHKDKVQEISKVQKDVAGVQSPSPAAGAPGNPAPEGSLSGAEDGIDGDKGPSGEKGDREHAGADTSDASLPGREATDTGPQVTKDTHASPAGLQQPGPAAMQGGPSGGASHGNSFWDLKNTLGVFSGNGIVSGLVGRAGYHLYKSSRDPWVRQI
ncbi:hypothetical protein BEWA_029230 [Theileria equi strain WA]|uniref:Uncharacterized protein n=1 Tax=Theileria equi strain WA TaxID=1537102 RepID=L0AXT8_THEEQ|nr:hypothetical protein BEWA_029230 [Theileria equi strain WA]AFZ80073.1 hypothetical protein BEWA_029230 [Theileria equi strain WA]|eukprot:XP_004829739.1 hypothetical protein BEWA_029230 [Theileria equi strain WA]